VSAGNAILTAGVRRHKGNILKALMSHKFRDRCIHFTRRSVLLFPYTIAHFSLGTTIFFRPPNDIQIIPSTSATSHVEVNI
jgi:hypothetical protein